MQKDSKMTLAQKENVRKGHLGLKYFNRKRPPSMTIETREKIRKKLMGNTHTLGRAPWNKGLKGVQVCSWKGQHPKWMQKENHPMWKGGISKKMDITELEWYEKRKEIYKRDGHTCQGTNCKNVGQRVPLDVHHINDDSNNNTLTNLISLCRSCHVKITWQVRKQIYANSLCANRRNSIR